ncbi:SecDF P1 head subdomain-containing protein [Achromobacter anxifer]
MRQLARAAALAALLPCAAYAETVVLHVARATAGADPQTSARTVDVELKPESRQALADFTRDRVGKRIQLRSGGVLLSSATLQSPLEGDSFRITAGEHGFAGKSAEEIAQSIMKSGGLTVDDENTAQ